MGGDPGEGDEQLIMDALTFMENMNAEEVSSPVATSSETPDATSAAEAAAAASASLQAATEAVELADGDVVSSDGVGNFAATLDGIAAAEMGEAATLAAEAIDHVGAAADPSIVEVGMEPVMAGARDGRL